VTFSDVRVFLVGLQMGSGNVLLTATKGGTSVFLDSSGDEWHFTHQETNPPFEFQYDGSGSCRVLSSSDSRLTSAGRDDIYVHYSPYGPWSISVDLNTGLDLSSVTAIRFEFNLAYKPGTFAGAHVLFTDSPGCTGELKENACSSDGTAAATPPPPAKPAAPSPPTSVACSDVSEFIAASDSVTVACCDEPSECQQDMPTTCNADCAAVLLPMQRACADFMAGAGAAMAGAQTLIDAAAAECPSSCADSSAFSAALKAVTAACCGSPSASCQGGLPTTACDAQCAAVLLPMQHDCAKYMAEDAMATAVQPMVAAAVALCERGH